MLREHLVIAVVSDLLSCLVEPSTSVKRKVTVPVGRSGRIDGSQS
jgi:hypothetical protein